MAISKRKMKVPTRVVRAEILAKASEVLGTRKAAKEWMSLSAMGLDGARPIDLVCTEDGARTVRDFLMRLELGVYN